MRSFFGLSLMAMLVIRVILAASVQGYAADVQTFQAWALQAADNLQGFYSGGFFADYPPGYLYVLFLVGTVKKLLLVDNGSRAFLVLIKLPAIGADLAAVLLIHRLAREWWGGQYALMSALLYGFNPAVILNSAVWGQVDAVYTLFIALSVVCLTRDWLVRAMAVFALAVLIKPQALIFTPLLLYALACRLFTLTALYAVGAFLAVFGAGILLFSIQEGPFWIFRHYGATLASYPYATLNAGNLFALAGGNFMPDTNRLLFFSFRTWGMLFIAVTTLFAVALCHAGRNRGGAIPYAAAFLSAAVFTLSSKMHERYLFPVLMLMMLSYLYTRHRQFLLMFAALSLSHFINVAEVLRLSLHGIYHIPRLDPLLLSISAYNLLLLGVLTVYGVKLWILPGLARPVFLPAASISAGTEETDSP